MATKISVIMPVFNRSAVINKSISSVLEQDYPNYELIIIDDGSTDGLEQKIQQLNSPVVRYCRLSRNAGQAYARNVGVSIAEGEILAFQDSDDVWYPHRMHRQVEAMQGYDFSFCAFEKGGIRWPAEPVDIERLYYSILSTPLIGTPTLFCTRDAFEKAGGFQVTYRCFEDYDLSLRLSKRFCGYYIDEVMLRAGESPVHVGGDENINEGLRVRCDLFMQYYRDIRENHLEQVWMDGLLRFQRLCDPVVFNYEMGKIRCFLSGMQEKVGFLNIQTAAYAQDLFSYAVGLGMDFKLNAPALGIPPPSHSDFTIGREGKNCEELLSFFKKKVIPSCTNFASEGFLGFPDAGNSISGLLGSILSDLMQQNLINESFCAPVATRMEIAVLQALRCLAGFPVCEDVERIEDVGGLVTYGGTGSNCIAMLLAREYKSPGTMIEGVRCPDHFTVVVPKGIGHYSIRSSLQWIGCGDKVIEVDTKAYRYDLDALQQVLEANRGTVMAVVAYAGDSRTMTLENLEQVETLVHKIDPSIWCHVDACHGFSLLFCDELKHRLRGIEKFDSVSFDPHKVMALPYCCSTLLLRDPTTLGGIVGESDLIMKEKLAFGKITPFIGSKSWISLKMWFLMQNLGLQGIGRMIRHRVEMAQYFRKRLEVGRNFLLLNSVDFNSVVFLWTGGRDLPLESLNQISRRMYEQLKKDCRYYFHQFPIRAELPGPFYGKYCYPLRYMSGNPNLTVEVLNQSVSYLEKLGENCYHEVCH